MKFCEISSGGENLKWEVAAEPSPRLTIDAQVAEKERQQDYWDLDTEKLQKLLKHSIQLTISLSSGKNMNVEN